MDPARVLEALTVELQKRREARFTGVVTVTVNMNQGGVTNAKVGEERRLVFTE